MAGSSAVAVMPVIKSAGQSLAEKTVCLKVGFGILGNSRRFSNSKIEVDADKALVKVSKLLLDSEELEDVRRYDNNFRARLRNLCLPYETSIHLVALGKVEDVDRECREFAAGRKPLVEAFKAAYPRLCERAERRLSHSPGCPNSKRDRPAEPAACGCQGIYDPRNYPPVEDLDRHFYFTHRFISMGVPGQLKDISPEVFKNERKKAVAVMNDAVVGVKAAQAEMAQELINNLLDRLGENADGSKKRLHKTTVTKLQEWLKDFDIQNVANFDELEGEVKRLDKLVGKVSVEELKDTDTVREKVKAGLAKASKVLEGMIEETSRKFRAEEE